jgi:hypothetical protein
MRGATRAAHAHQELPEAIVELLDVGERTHYARSSRLSGGEAACASDVRIKRTVAESGLLRRIKSDLLTPEIIADIGRET